MITRRSFLCGAASMAVLSQLGAGSAQAASGVSGVSGLNGDDTVSGGPRRYNHGAAAAEQPVPEGYPYDRPIPDARTQIMTPLPPRVVAGYWTHWGAPIRLTDIPVGYNTVFLFHATPVGGAPGTTGAVRWNGPGNGRGADSSFTADLAEFRRTRTAILAVGGARAHVDLSTRARAQVFLDSIKRIYGELGGFDGLDWNTYEGEQQPDTEQMIWVSRQLKAAYGQDFAITSPPAPWREKDMAHCRAMIDAGVLDMVSPQYYDGPGLASEDHIVDSVEEWVARMGDAGRVGVGFGLAEAADYSTPAAVEGAWKRLAGRHPRLRGAYNWAIPTDEDLGWPFAHDVGPRVMIGAPIAPLIVPPVFPLRRRAPTVVEPHAVTGSTDPATAGLAPAVSTPTTSTPARSTPTETGTHATAIPAGSAPASSSQASPSAASGPRLPERVLGTYWSPGSGLPLSSVHPDCTVIWIDLGAGTVSDGTGIGVRPGDGAGAGIDPGARPDRVRLTAGLAELRRRTVAPKLILSGVGVGGPNSVHDLATTTGADQYALEIIQTARDHGFDGFELDLGHAPDASAAHLERASRIIITEMRRTSPAFTFTVSSFPLTGGNVPRGDHGRAAAEFVRRCRDIIDLLQPQVQPRVPSDNGDDRTPGVTGLREEVRAWLDCGLRQDQIGIQWRVTPAASTGEDGSPGAIPHATQVWDALTVSWPGLRGMSISSLVLHQAWD